MQKRINRLILTEPAVNKDADLYLIDVNGKTEGFSDKFIDTTKLILDINSTTTNHVMPASMLIKTRLVVKPCP
jgi:hypothetical protein